MVPRLSEYGAASSLALARECNNQMIRLSSALSPEQFHSITGGGPSISEHMETCLKFQELGAASKEIVGLGFRATSVIQVPTSTYLIFYVHGGGFVSGSSLGSAKYLLQMFLELEQRGIVCDIISVDYDLSPGAVYPTALRQVICAYRYGAAQGKDIVLMGDSAGGNLCLGLLQHLALPNPLLETPIEKPGGGRITAMCLLSPWVNLRTDGPSVYQYKSFDCLDKTVLDEWARHYMGPRNVLDCYSNPIEREKHWGTIMPKHSMILAGGMELFLSDIMDFARKVSVASSLSFFPIQHLIWQQDREDAMELLVTPSKGHAWAAVDYGFKCGARQLAVATSDDSKEHLEGLSGLLMQVDWIAKELNA
ncbi:alpha/beta-hydrolase [Aaosphaeria arxii CBS 175.79]|uniref:Alpha/beta-hydrolase n=1 Tax=Aaosphaeria arxii CBS 175.79 TaxID=1450172 RepID=A0A6A5X7F8_9PLEO|nr:alpha/beta-hydrolase [Aaosphaeria arxii CBS 175.79]KAF2008862.1 alpha/beta-hydrolase [Aaosphaeria arxii CBS 175.79]